jgi:hypothetical protein
MRRKSGRDSGYGVVRTISNALPNRVLYLSSGMLARIDNESELAGLLAHEFAHSLQGSPRLQSVASRFCGRNASSGLR